MANTIVIVDNGPMKLTGDFELLDEKGDVVRARKLYMICRCGLSNRLPFCDSTHDRLGFSSCPRAPHDAASAGPATPTPTPTR